MRLTGTRGRERMEKQRTKSRTSRRDREMEKEETLERKRERERRNVETANFERVKREIWDKRNYVRKRGKFRGGGGEGQVKNLEST